MVFLGGKTSWLGSGRDWEFQVDFPAAEPQEKPSPGPGVGASSAAQTQIHLPQDWILAIFIPSHSRAREKSPAKFKLHLQQLLIPQKYLRRKKKFQMCCSERQKCGFKGKFHLISHLREQNTRAKSSWQWNQGYFWTLYFHFWAPSSPFPPLQDFPKVDFSEVRNQICKSKGLQEIKGWNPWCFLTLEK